MSPFDAFVLIPTLHPDHLLFEYIQDLITNGFKSIIVVDDGSGPEYAPLFDKLRKLDACDVIGYPVNQGKGHALKYGIRYIMEHYPDALGIVTADSDGQHTTEDIIKVSQALMKHPQELIIGSRDFSANNVPIKSLAGNRMTSFFFALLYGKWLPDTQTGLRAFSNVLFPLMLEVPGERFEYEMNMLILASARLVNFHTVTIQTIYIEENRQTHFRPFHDSLIIYLQLFKNFFKYASASGLSTVLDILLFILLDKWLLPLIGINQNTRILWGISLGVLLANTLARIVSSVFNYKVNKSLVFQVDKCKGSFQRYVMLALMVLITSTTLISLLSLWLPIDNTLIKMFVDSILFFLNYRLQRSWVFGKSYC